LRPEKRQSFVDVVSASAYPLHFTTMPHGGHFPAFEQPKLWVDDIRAFFAAVRKDGR